MNGPDTPCDFAKMAYLEAARWRNLWTILVYAFGVTLVLFAIAAILLFIRSTWLPAALTTLGTIVSGAGISWVVNQRTISVAEQAAAFKQLKRECGPPGPAFMKIQQQQWFSELESAAWKSLYSRRS